MKHTLLIITALMLTIGYSQETNIKPIDGNTLIIKVCLMYTSDSDKPYSGEAVWYYSNGQKEKEVTYKDGKWDGKWTGWYENGQKRVEETYKDGNADGAWTYWHEKTGQKRSEGTFKGVNRYGIPIKDGKWTDWYENGQKRTEITYKDGKWNGKWTEWHEKTGQKVSEKTYKDGIRIEWLRWDRDGNKK